MYIYMYIYIYIYMYIYIYIYIYISISFDESFQTAGNEEAIKYAGSIYSPQIDFAFNKLGKSGNGRVNCVIYIKFVITCIAAYSLH